MTDAIQLSNLLGLAMRAGKVVTGEEIVIRSMQKQSAELVFLANDAASNLTKTIKNKGTYYKIEVSTILSNDEISGAIGKYRKVIAITDKGFAKKMRSIMNG